MISNIKELNNYSEYKAVVARYGEFPNLMEAVDSYSVSFEKDGMVYHRHLIKGGAEAAAMLADFWPYIEDYRVEYGNYAIPTNTTLPNRKPVTAIMPQASKVLTVASVTASTITFATNSLKRTAVTGVTVGTANSNGNGTRLTVASTTGWTVGMRIAIRETNKIDTLAYIINVVSSTVLEIDGSVQDTYTLSGSTTQLVNDLEGRYVITSPLGSLTRYRITTMSNDTLTLNTGGVDLTTILAANDSIRISEEHIKIVQIIMSGDANMTVSVDQYNPSYYGDTLLHELARIFVLSAGGTFVMNLPIKLSGNDGDYLIVRVCDTKNLGPNAYISITANVQA